MFKKIYLPFMLCLLILSVSRVSFFSNAIANPASLFCEDSGGTLEIRSGQMGYCVFPDGSECEEWKMFNNQCQNYLNFADVSSTNPYAQEIKYLKNHGISYGFNNGTEYRPDINIQRQTLVTLIVKAKYSETEINNCIRNNGFEGKNIFNDVASTHHFAPFICMAKVKQIAVGYSSGDFGDTRPTKAHEAIKMIMRTLDEKLTLPINAPLEDYTKRLQDLGFYPSTINKQNEDKHETTRAEIAYIIQIIRDNYKSIPSNNDLGYLSKNGYTMFYPEYYNSSNLSGFETAYISTIKNDMEGFNNIGVLTTEGGDGSLSEIGCDEIADEVSTALNGNLNYSKLLTNGDIQECRFSTSLTHNNRTLHHIQRHMWTISSENSKIYATAITYTQNTPIQEIKDLKEAYNFFEIQK